MNAVPARPRILVSIWFHRFPRGFPLRNSTMELHCSEKYNVDLVGDILPVLRLFSNYNYCHWFRKKLRKFSDHETAQNQMIY